ncbi:MAG TPA: hypothetical protein VG347_20115 [Verrucomicrobiae bacterium]|nr:hypothetical protein [Verrucomicrobiae bacterium]
MAWSYSQYVGKVAAAGKTEYPLPMFVNTWMADWRKSSLMKPGIYPSSGQMPFVMDIWKAGGPQINILSSDIYSNFEERCALYHRADNPLFIPELVRETRTCSAIFHALGQYDSFGFSAFGMESLPDFSEEMVDPMPSLHKSPCSFGKSGKGCNWRRISGQGSFHTAAAGG